MARKYTKTVDRMPKQLQVAVLARKMTPTALKELADTYAEARMKRVLIKQPTASEFRLASLAKEHGYSGAAAKAGAQAVDVYSAVSRVSRYNWFNGTVKK